MKQSAFFLIAYLFFFQQVFAQDIRLEYANEISTNDLRQHLTSLASEEMQGRKSGTFGQRVAAEYITKQFRKIGLISPPNVTGYTQYFTFQSTGYIPTSFTIGKSDFQTGVDYLPLENEGNKESGFKASQIIFSGYGITDGNYDDYRDKDIKGKVVVIFPGEPKENEQFIISGTNHYSTWGKNISEKIRLAKEKGAEAVLVINPSENIFLASPAALPGKENGLLPSPLPVIRIVPQMLNQLFGEAAAQTLLQLHKEAAPLMNLHLETEEKIKLTYGFEDIIATSSNIIGMIEGSDKKEEYVILSAHYDHMGIEGKNIFFGADDNGSGTSALLEMAESFMAAKKAGHGPGRSILFVAFSGEEQGLYGSSHFTIAPIISLDSVSANLNTDMVGRWDFKRNKEYIYVVGDNQISSELNPLINKVNKKYTGLKLDDKYNNPKDPERLFYRSDHFNFANKGVPVVFFTNGVHPDYHQPGDTVDKIDFNLLKKRTQLIFLTAWEIANRENMMARDLRYYFPYR